MKFKNSCKLSKNIFKNKKQKDFGKSTLKCSNYIGTPFNFPVTKILRDTKSKQQGWSLKIRVSSKT